MHNSKASNGKSRNKKDPYPYNHSKTKVQVKVDKTTTQVNMYNTQVEFKMAVRNKVNALSLSYNLHTTSYLIFLI